MRHSWRERRHSAGNSGGSVSPIIEWECGCKVHTGVSEIAMPCLLHRMEFGRKLSRVEMREGRIRKREAPQ